MRPAPELSIVVPTFNERANVPILVERLSRPLPSADWEIVFVDDNSPDGTAAAARAIGETDSLDPVLASPVRLIYFIS